MRTTRNRQRGFVLVAALTLAVLYFALMELVLIDASRSLMEAQRFRARIVAAALAENGAELAAQQIALHPRASVEMSDFQGTMTGTLRLMGGRFELEGQGTAIGAMRQDATVKVQGRIDTDGLIKIDYTVHTQ